MEPASQDPQQPTNQPITPNQQPSAVKKETSGKAIAALVFGICSLLIAPLGIVAIIFGVLALGEIKRKDLEGKGMAIAGIVLGAIGLVMIFFVMLGALAYFGVLSPGNMLPEHTMFSAPFTNSEPALVTSDGLVQVPLQNYLGEAVTITGFADGAYGGCEGGSIRGISIGGVEQSLPLQVADGEDFVVVFRCPAMTAEEYVNMGLGFTYSVSSGLERNHVGTVRARVRG